MIKNVAPEQNKNYTVDIVEALQSGVIIIDDETLRILYINPAGASIIGRERSDILGKVCYNFICPPSDKPCHIRGMNECCQFSEKLLLTASGKTIPVLKNAIRIIYEERNCILESFFSLAEHRGIEARLRLNEHSLNEIQRIAHIGSFIYNLKTGTWKSTPILDEILGIDENFDRTSAGWDYLLDSDWKKVLTAYFKTELNQNHKQFEMEFPIIRKSDGKIRWVNGVGKLEADNEKKFIRMLGSIQDITEHRNVREEIVKLAKFPEENPNPVLRVSENGNLLYANDASKLFRGRLKSTTTENGSQHWKTDIFDIKKTGERKLSKKWMENVTKALESGKVIHDELQYHDQYFSMSYAPVPEAGYVNIYSFDITDQKRDEQYLIVQQHVSQILTEEETFPNANQRILKSIINSLQWEWGETWWLDADLDILTLSAYWFNPDLDLYEFETESLQTTFEYGIGLPGQIWKNKSPIWIGDVAKDPTFCRSEIASKSDLHGAFAFPIQFDNDFIGVLVFFSKKVLSYDNSLLKLMGNIGNQLGQFIKRRDAEKKLVKAKNIAETANKSKSIFLANMSHELRTPLNAILGFCQLMEREESLPERSKEYLGIIGQSGEHLLNMINSVLELSKIEAGKNTLQIFSFDMIQTLENLEKMLALRAKWKGLTLCIRINPSTPNYISTDEGKLRQILLNLLGNAIKFTDRGSVVLQVYTVEIPDEKNNVILGFTVTDTGPGIPEEEVEKIFDAFTQTESKQSLRTGTGLGLTISRQFIRLLNGEIKVDSTLGVGTTFTFQIKVQLALESDIKIIKSPPKILGLEPAQYGKDGRDYHILVVDDNLENRIYLTSLLQQIGFSVSEAVNGWQALEQADTLNPHLILMDIKMPGLNGYETAQMIRNHYRKTEKKLHPIIIALTAGAFEENRVEALKKGFDSYISKPFRDSEILQLIGEQLNLKYVISEPVSDSDVKTRLKLDHQYLIKSIASLPVLLISKLKEATELGDIPMLEGVIEKIGNKNRTLADKLKELTTIFSFDDILHAISKLKGSTSSERFNRDTAVQNDKKRIKSDE